MTSANRRIEILLSQMTLDEKLAQMGSCWFFELQTHGELDPVKLGARLKEGIGQITRPGGASTLPPVGIARAGNRIQKYLIEHTRLGIPAILHEESCCGAMVLGGTMYPQMLGLAATFRPALAEAMTRAIRDQLLAIGARLVLGPVLDLAFDARWGRTEETFGEDPTLTAHFGMAYIRGLQSDNLARGVAATGKHFIGHSLSQGGQNCGPVHLGMRELQDVYLIPFQAAIRDAGLAAIMNAYPEVDGEIVAASRRILTELLRDQLGFEGPVVSDYESVTMIHNYHHAAADLSRAASMALHAGIDVELPTLLCYGDPLKDALEAGAISLELVDNAVRRHLQLKVELGLLDNPYVSEEGVAETFETPANRQLARQIAGQSLVLLKNDGILPLKKTGQTLAVIGPHGDTGRNQLGGYSYAAVVELMTLQAPEGSSFVGLDAASLAQDDIRVVTILQGIKAIVPPETKVLFAPGCGLLDGEPEGLAKALAIAEAADVIILALGERSGLVPSCTTGETRDSADLRLPPVQEELARRLLEAGKPIVLVLINGRPLAVPWLAEHMNAILEAWLPGEEGGGAVAEVLFGETNPGGKLPITFPRAVGQVPLTYNHKPSGMRSNWYVDYVAEKAAPLYPFGHGLSYTTFEYGSLSISPAQATAGERVAICVAVTNTGRRAGEEVVQLYVRDEFASVPRPVKQLMGFARVELRPGERKTIRFDLPIDQLGFISSAMKLVIEPGRILVMIGSSSEDIRLQGEFEIVGPDVMPIENRVFACPVEIEP
ncbi:MAG: glycoside hydrolase family 3 C-terminal domain-containing protein [Anaerolineales bacterium]|nr:glycoside hydrolase family 3 C-terminal domain-containing protein [Anaerolineales bacterium]